MNTFQILRNLFLLLLVLRISSCCLLLGMDEKNENLNTLFDRRDLNKLRQWDEEKNKYIYICLIKNCNKKLSSSIKLENHLIARHHVCPCCDNNMIWDSLADLCCHFIKMHPCQGRSRKGVPRYCFYCNICEKKITLLRGNFESHQKNCYRKHNIDPKLLTNHLEEGKKFLDCSESPIQYFLPELFPEI